MERLVEPGEESSVLKFHPLSRKIRSFALHFRRRGFAWKFVRVTGYGRAMRSSNVDALEDSASLCGIHTRPSFFGMLIRLHSVILCIAIMHASGHPIQCN